MAERLMTTAEVARRLGVHATTVTRWVREGALRPDRRTLVGRHARFTAATVEDARRRMLGAAPTAA